jgi:hypothetical protein
VSELTTGSAFRFSVERLQWPGVLRASKGGGINRWSNLHPGSRTFDWSKLDGISKGLACSLAHLPYRDITDNDALFILKSTHGFLLFL